MKYFDCNSIIDTKFVVVSVDYQYLSLGSVIGGSIYQASVYESSISIKDLIKAYINKVKNMINRQIKSIKLLLVYNDRNDQMRIDYDCFTQYLKISFHTTADI